LLRVIRPKVKSQEGTALKEIAQAGPGIATSEVSTAASSVTVSVSSVVIDQFILPTDIDGLDSELGLRRVSGKIALYETILRKYIASQSTVIDELRAAVAQQDFELATSVQPKCRASLPKSKRV
jgi:hypothetical protein